MPTECLFRDDSYLKSCEARVLAVTDKGIVLDQSRTAACGWRSPDLTNCRKT
jgi:Ser-tRNA(Ala) deacylase AlaX